MHFVGPMAIRARDVVVALGLFTLPFAASVAVGGASVAQEQFTVGEVVRSITVEGNSRYRDEQLISMLGLAVGAPLGVESLDRGIRQLFETFHVRASIEKRAATDGGIDVRVVVEELPLDLEPRFVGNVDIDDDELLEWAGLREREELFLFQAPRVRDRLMRAYRDEGYYFAQVNVVERPGGVDEATGEFVPPDVIFEVEEGPEVKVREIVFSGNESLVNERRYLFFKRGLSKLAQVELRSPLFFSWFAKDFVDETLQADIIAMREVYRDFGYLDAIVEVSELEFTEDREWVTVHVAIDEGGRYKVGSITLEGVERVPTPGTTQDRPAELVFPKEELMELLDLHVGDTYERRIHNDDARALRQFYGEHGYIDHRSLSRVDRWEFLEPELTFEADQPVVHVTYRIAQGRQVFIREIPIVGNLHTQDRVIRRLITMQPGEAADPREIERSRARIQSTGFFSDQFDITHPEPSYRFIDTEDPNWKDLEFFVDEGQVLTFNIAGGVSSNNGAFGQISLSMRNFDVRNMPESFGGIVDDITTREAFHGAGQELRLSAAPGTEVSFYNIRFTEPDLFGDHVDRISLSLSASKQVRLYSSHDEERREIGFRLGRAVTIDSNVFTGFQTGSVDVSDIDRDGAPSLSQPLSVPADLKAQEGNLKLAHIIAGYSLREVDSRINTRNGVRFTFENRLYHEALGSEAEFIKSELRFDWWSEFDNDPEIVSPYYHVQLGTGVAVPFGDDDSVPYTERYYLGGLNTLRGYRFRGVGPNENGFPIGGQTMLHGTLEYRVPLVKQVQPGTYREYESIHGGLFIDFGVLDPEEFALDPDEVRVTAGFLFGIGAPIPLTFSFGWPIVDVAGSGDSERVFGFSISNN